MSTEEEKAIRLAMHIVTKTIGDVSLVAYLFGSRAKGVAKPFSDIDIALEAESPISRFKLSLLREELAESAIPFNVDIIDLRTASPNLVERVRSEGIPWKD